MPQYTCLCSTGPLKCNVVAARVGSHCSSRSRFSRLAEQEEEEEEKGREVEEAICSEDLVVTGAVEVEGDGSKPLKETNKYV